jgi:hypothetical protein
MIIVKKTGYLKYKNFKFRCALGKNGIKKKVKEGDFVAYGCDFYEILTLSEPRELFGQNIHIVLDQILEQKTTIQMQNL